MEAVSALVQAFIDEWPESAEDNRQAFATLHSHLAGLDEVALEFHPRPGITYSLRGVHARQQAKPLFVMVDVIEDEPRWLSVCFYGEMISDPDGRGDFVPGGLLGEDAVCFDMERADPEILAYLKARIDEAYAQAGSR